MGISSDLLNAPREFLQLFKEGKEAAKRGDQARAHELFRRAVEIDPYHEQIWLWLASVVESDDDRRVCFENVLALNPTHPTAHQQLHLLDEKRLHEALSTAIPVRKRLSRRRKLFRLALVLLIAVVASLAIIALRM
jgi:ferric-dicitrate binding protein FerR (iron transport regulator)